MLKKNTFCMKQIKQDEEGEKYGSFCKEERERGGGREVIHYEISNTRIQFIHIHWQLQVFNQIRRSREVCYYLSMFLLILAGQSLKISYSLQCSSCVLSATHVGQTHFEGVYQTRTQQPCHQPSKERPQHWNA